MEETPPRSPLRRQARLGGLVGGQGVRWAATQAANRLRSPAAAQVAQEERALELADALVRQLGSMKGAAMKLGQVLSTVEFQAIPEGSREQFRQRLAALRDQAPPVAFQDMQRVLEVDLEQRTGKLFAEWDPEPLAAASIGQVYRALDHQGRELAVKIQYPGIAEAVDSDLRSAGLLLPLLRRLAPGLQAKPILAELGERIREELDYEWEAQQQRRVARAFRGHPLIRVPAVIPEFSGRRVLCSELVRGQSFEQVCGLPEAQRDRFGELLFRACYGLLIHRRLAYGDPHPGNYLLADDDRLCLLDFGLMRQLDRDYLDRERALAAAVIRGDAEAAHQGLAELGYLPQPEVFQPQRLLEQLQAAGEWYFFGGFRRLDPDYVRQLIEVGSTPRSPFFDYMRQQTIPPQALLMRRMESMLLASLGELRAGADWSAIALEYMADQPPSTLLGQLDQNFWSGA